MMDYNSLEALIALHKERLEEEVARQQLENLAQVNRLNRSDSPTSLRGWRAWFASIYQRVSSRLERETEREPGLPPVGSSAGRCRSDLLLRQVDPRSTMADVHIRRVRFGAAFMPLSQSRDKAKKVQMC
jgi:hypothetical protein